MYNTSPLNGCHCDGHFMVFKVKYQLLFYSLALLFMQSTVWWQYQSLQQISNNVASGCDSIWIFRTCLYSFTLFHMCCMGFCVSFPLLLFDLYTTTIETYAKLGFCLTLNVCSNILTHILVYEPICTLQSGRKPHYTNINLFCVVRLIFYVHYSLNADSVSFNVFNGIVLKREERERERERRPMENINPCYEWINGLYRIRFWLIFFPFVTTMR